MTDFYHSIIGLPESGKTTFLAALWHIIDAGEVSTELVLDKLVGNHRYLNEIVDIWRKCIKVPRTSGLDETSVSIHMHHPATKQRIALNFPDLSGESFELQFSARNCTTEYVDSYEGDGGILLFINANRAQDGINILDLAPVFEGTDDVEITANVKKWSPDLVSQQVRLVELLQFLQRPPFTCRRRRLVVAISAWDVIELPSLKPENWLERECPLLYQYLVANPDSFEFRVYGISAQGGDLPKDDDDTEEKQKNREELLRKPPSERVVCIGPDTNPHDLTAPICWLSEME